MLPSTPMHSALFAVASLLQIPSRTRYASSWKSTCIDILLVSAHSPISNTSTLLSRESLPVVLILRELSSRDFAPL